MLGLFIKLNYNLFLIDLRPTHTLLSRNLIIISLYLKLLEFDGLYYDLFSDKRNVVTITNPYELHFREHIVVGTMFLGSQQLFKYDIETNPNLKIETRRNGGFKLSVRKSSDSNKFVQSLYMDLYVLFVLNDYN